MNRQPPAFPSRFRLFLLCALLASCGQLAAATLSVGSVNVNQFSPGDAVQIPVTVTGISPEAFTAFTVSLAYDTAGLRLDSVVRGDLIDATGAAAAAAYAPYLWALEMVQDQAAGTLNAGGMVLQALPGQNTLAGMAAALATEDAGVLLWLNFTLVDVRAASVSVVTGGINERTALVHETTGTIATLQPAEADLTPGGTSLEGITKAWAQKWFGTDTCDDQADPDHDWRTNLVEFQEQTDPTTADQRLVFKPGWNMIGFSSVPETTTAEWVEATNAAHVHNGGAGMLVVNVIYHFDSSLGHYCRTTGFDGLRGYWVYAFQDGETVSTGVPVAADWTFPDATGWQLVAPPAALAARQLPQDVDACFGWDAAKQLYLGDIVELLPGHAYWLAR